MFMMLKKSPSDLCMGSQRRGTLNTREEKCVMRASPAPSSDDTQRDAHVLCSGSLVAAATRACYSSSLVVVLHYHGRDQR